MKLEDELQLEFEDDFQKAILNILVVADNISSTFNTVLKPYGISKEQYNVLRILSDQHPEPSTIQSISGRMISKSSNVTRLVEKLRKKGLVDRLLCETDRRKVDVVITTEGLELLKEADPLVLSSGRGMRTITEEEARELNRILDKIRE